MKKLLLAVALLSAGLCQASFNPQKAWGDAPAAPTKTGGGFMDMLGGAAGTAGSAATGIPPINVGFALGFSEASTDIDSDVSQSANVSGGAQAQIQQGQNVSVYGESTATTSATGMGK